MLKLVLELLAALLREVDSLSWHLPYQPAPTGERQVRRVGPLWQNEL